MYKTEISYLLSRSVDNIFDSLIEAIEAHFNRPVSSILEMKERGNKKLKGDLWENFCKDWLLATGKYSQVWLLSEWDDYALNAPESYQLTKQDNGIDLIAATKTGYVAIQCKYRKKGYVNWSSLSTFIGLCERTGPWEKYIVMTNAKGITRKLPQTEKDKAICLATFRSTSREVWLKIAGLYLEHSLDPSSTMSSVQTATTSSSSEVVVENKQLSQEEMRAARLARFDKK